MFCPIERARVFQGKTWRRCALLEVCGYRDKHVNREIDALSAGPTPFDDDDYIWPRVKPSSEEEWYKRPPRPERDSGDTDRVSAELNEFGETAAFFDGEKPLLISEDGFEVSVNGTSSVLDRAVAFMPPPIELETTEEEEKRLADLLGLQKGSFRIDSRFETISALAWVPVSRLQGGTRCPLYSPFKDERAVVGRRFYHRQWGIVVGRIDPDGVKATVVKTGHITKRVLVSHLRPL
jgi:hypothetical protein